MYEQKLRGLKLEQERGENSEKAHEISVQEFLDKTEKKSAHKETLKLLNCAIEAEEIRLNNKRER